MEKTDNELIAEFMGKRVMKFGGAVPMIAISTEGTRTHWSALQYDTSWDWLMPVVEKIRELTIAVEIYLSLGAICKICYKKDQSFQWLSLEDNDAIRAVYMACVEYIKWYNAIDKSSITEK
jgi:hypothetical protein